MAPPSWFKLINMARLHSPAAVFAFALYIIMWSQLVHPVSPVASVDWLCNSSGFNNILVSSGLLCFSSYLSFSGTASMPRSRGIPRRGGRYGIRVSPSPSEAQQITPIALVQPSSPHSDQERANPNSSYQSSRFVFQSRLNRPTVTVNFSVFVSEEETHHPSSTPLVSSSSQDESVLLGDMTRLVYHPDCINEGAPAPNVPQKPTPAEEDDKDSEPAHFHSGNLHLVTDSAGELLLDEEGYVTWVASPSPVKEEKHASPSQAD